MTIDFDGLLIPLPHQSKIDLLFFFLIDVFTVSMPTTKKMAFKRQPPQAELRIPTVPNFPLSSPITEEVASPTSSSSDDRDQERNRPFEYLAKVSSRNPFIHRAEYGESTGQRPLAGETNDAFFTGDEEIESGSKPSAATTKKNPDRPVGLNLVTDFSLSAPNPREESAPNFVDLHDLKVLSKVREEERNTQKIKGILKKTTEGLRHPDGASESSSKRRSAWFDLKPKKKPKDDLSPSDRPIMIGFSVPYDESPDPQKERSKELDSSDNLRTPLTPSIIVTPAKEDDSFWAGLGPEVYRPRVASSVYSQPTPNLEDSETKVPPVPAIPAQHAPWKNETISPDSPHVQTPVSTRKHRSYSAGTVFEEDDGPRAGLRSRSYSNGSVKRALDRLSGLDGSSRLSITSEVNRHQSQGWWTYLLSPMLGRSSTMTSRKTPIDEDRPPVPSLKTNLTGSSDEWWEKEVSCFSPDTPETAVANRGEVASWHCEKNPFADFNSITDVQTEPLGERNAASFMFPGTAIQGSAAEYYQACAHELFSRKPYFECIDHVCSITPAEQILTRVDDEAAGSTWNEKGLLIDVESQSGIRSIRDSEAPTSVSKTCSCGGSVAVDKEPETLHESPKGNSTPRNSAPAIPEADSPAPQPRGFAEGPAANDKDIPQNTLPETSRAGPPESHTQTSADRLVPPPIHVSQQQNSHPFEPKCTLEPPVTPFYIPPASPQPPAPVMTTERIIPQYVVLPPHPGVQPQAPDPISPGFQRATEGNGSIPLSDMHTSPAPAYTSHRNSPVPLPARVEPLPVTRDAMAHPFTERDRIESRRRRLEKEDAIGKKAGGLWRGRGPFSKKGCFGRPGREGRLRRRWYFAIVAFFLAIVIVAVVLAIVLTRRGDKTPVQSQWLNLTGYPPMPTGVATVAGPEAQVQNSGCIAPSSLWSCALPKEDQAANKPYAADQPNFRMEIRFRNGTYPNSTTVASESGKRAISIRSDDLFDPSPSAPDMKEQTFMGNTTDQNTVPYAGEETPFYMTFLSPIPISKLARRADTTSFPDLDSLIPSPASNSDGTAASANLYPLPESQPIRLYNRGQDTEHYGFYTYFDRSIFLASSAPLNGTKTDMPKSDATGGSSKKDARVRCTWAQTRFHVQIWTRSSKTLLNASSTTSATPTATTKAATSTSSSSATNLLRPGSFPYPVTITLDRHGGDAKKKMVYCYGMEDQHINSTEKKLQIEDRGLGGKLVNAAPGVFNISSSAVDSSLGGVDGGTGGCACQWRNWVSRT